MPKLVTKRYIRDFFPKVLAFFFFNDTATTEIYTLSLHDTLPISYASMGIPTDQFTPIFALSRVVGWSAHVLEQHANNRLIRPRAEYTGPTHATYVPIDRR